MQPDLALVIAKLSTLRKDDGLLIVPEYAQVSIIRFEQPVYINSTRPAAPCYYQVYLVFPLNKKKDINPADNAYSVSRRVENVERADDDWIRTLTSMMQEETEQRQFILRRSQQARRQQWLLGDTSTRIDGKESSHVPPRQRGFMF